MVYSPVEGVDAAQFEVEKTKILHNGSSFVLKAVDGTRLTVFGTQRMYTWMDTVEQLSPTFKPKAESQQIHVSEIRPFHTPV